MTNANETRLDDTNSLFEKGTQRADSGLYENSQLNSASAKGAFKTENERKEQSVAGILPALQIGDFAKGMEQKSADLSLVKADVRTLGRDNYDANGKPKLDERDLLGSKTMPDGKSPTATIVFNDGDKTTVPMPPAKPGSRVDFYMPRDKNGGFCLVATAGDTAWALKKDLLGGQSWSELKK